MHAVILLSLVLTADASSAPADDMREFMTLQKERLRIPGVSVALIDEGAVQYMAFGVRRSGGSDEVSSIDRFNIGSITKTFTAWAVMHLAEQGLVSLDTPVQEYLDQRWQLPDSDFDSASVTLRRILSHTAGLSAQSYQGFPWGSRPITLEESLNGDPVRSSAVRIIAEPGGEYRYSGGGFTVAQLVIENVTGRSFSEVMTSEIFGPLGIEHAEYLTFNQEPLAVSPHDYEGRPISDYRMVEQGAGGLRASAHDLVDFIMANMGPNPLLSGETVIEMHEPVVAIGEETEYALGFERRGNLLSHGGHGRGWVAHIDFQPNRKSGLVILTNSANGLHLIQPVRCEWSKLFDIDDLKPYCEKRMLTARVTRWILICGSCVALVLAIWLAWRSYLDLKNRAAKVSFNAASLIRGSGYVLTIGATWAVLGTELGVYLVSGVRWGLPTINYFPAATMYFASALTSLLGVLLFTTFLSRKSA